MLFLKMNKNLSEGLFIKEGRTLVYIAYKNIMWAEAEGNYITIHIYHHKDRITRTTLTQLMERLPSGKFIRVHKSYLVHNASVTEIHSNVLFLGQKQIPIGRSYKKSVGEHFAVMLAQNKSKSNSVLISE